MFALPLATTTECVRVVVDYGTFADSPAGPNTHCTSVPYGATAADALQRRHDDLHTAAPRYKGNFLCGIDGYPETGCGDDPSVPYWSVWIWRHGKWEYSQLGVDSLTVDDADHDGHPDPLGFRYQPQGPEVTPRSNPAYPSSTPAATSTAPTPTHPPAAVATTAPARTATATRATSARPAATTPVATTAAALPPPQGTPPGIPPKRKRLSFPTGLVGGGALALTLLGAAAWQFRRTADR